MTATNSNSDKYAFLFRTGTDDMTPFEDTLKDYYGYLPANIVSSSGCANLINDFKALAVTIEASSPSGSVPSGETPMNTLFVIISGDADSSGLTDGTDSVPWLDLRDMLSGQFPGSGPIPLPETINYDTECEINVLLITPHCQALRSEWLNNIPFSNGTLLLPETEADDSLTAAKKSSFISSWADLMRLANPSILTVDKLVSIDAISADIYPAGTTGYFIAQREPADIGDPFYPGRFELLIRDGDHPGVGSSWWNSPDIWITNSCYTDIPANEGNNRYMTGEINKVHVRVYNTGCHPLLPNHIGVTVFPYPFATGDTNVTPVNTSVNNVLFPGGSELLYTWDYDFPAGVDHRCIRAIIHYDAISPGIDQPAIWHPHTSMQEAQKNITPASISCSGGGGEAPGGGEMPAPVPPGEEGGTPPDPEGAGEKSIENIRNFRELELLIENPFRNKREFRLVIPAEVAKLRKKLDIQLFTFSPGKPGRIFPVKLKKKKENLVSFTLMPGQQLNLMLYISVRKGVKEFKKMEISLEVIVQRTDVNQIFRAPVLRSFKKFGSVAGITFDVSNESVDVSAEVVDSSGKPVGDAIVHLSTVNGRQAAKLITDSKGKCEFRKINPGAYNIAAYKGKLWSGKVIVNAYPRKDKSGPNKLVIKRRK